MRYVHGDEDNAYSRLGNSGMAEDLRLARVGLEEQV